MNVPVDQIVKEGTTTFTLADGTVISLTEWLDTELRATFDLVKSGKDYRWDPFEVPRSMPLRESGQPATLADTNLYLSGQRGLPNDWEFWVFGWRASVEGPKTILDSEEWATFAAHTHCELTYYGKPYTDATLSDLRKHLLVDSKGEGGYIKPEEVPPAMMLGGTLTLPIRMREGLSYGVTVSAENSQALSALRNRLSRYDARVLVRVSLRGLLKRCIA